MRMTQNASGSICVCCCENDTSEGIEIERRSELGAGFLYGITRRIFPLPHVTAAIMMIIQ